MSYARFGANDVCVYLDVKRYLNCRSCCLSGHSVSFDSTEGMFKHLRLHQEMGHTVQDHVFENLELDKEQNDKFIETGLWGDEK